MSAPVPSPDRRPSDEEYLTAPEAARLLKVSLPTVWRWIKAEWLPAVRVGRRSLRIKRADLATVIRPATEHRAGAGGMREHGHPSPTAGAAGLTLSQDQIEHSLAALAAARTFADEQRRRRGGRRLPSSDQLIREGREARSRGT